MTHDSLFESNRLDFSSTDSVDFLNEEPSFFWTSVNEFNFKIGVLWFYATQKLDFHIICRSFSAAKELSKDLWIKVMGKNTRNPFPEETNTCRERVWGFCSPSSTANSAITLQEAALYSGWVAGLGDAILK